MRSTFRFFVLLAGSLLAVPVVAAQEPLTLSEALERARTNAPHLA